MRQAIFTVLVSLMFAVSVWAGPFLTCDPQTNVTSYIVTLDGVTQEVPAQDLGDNTTRLHFDLAGILDGEHDGSVASKNVWGESAAVPFSINKTLPECPSALTIIAQ